ncbi:hypothetical protein B9Z55_007896 [Caenorhabditis nigoni]|uniref:BTB domain-containing protein n=1 Tax=Caenorhabditis nigoni TaxID=1611254 RepID=A0A2G5VBV3_9PELO|nr:hypothetical protein B9Z55_007896 [Caenorhabditis nigoni]
MADTVKLDVGGTVFKTTKSTLTKFDGFFRTMFETLTPVPKDDSGAIFIDRDPTHFRLILNFMRDGHVDLRKYSEDMTEIQKEAQYYLLGGLMELCASKPESQKMPYFAETYEDMARTVASSTKKVVCTVFFGTTHRNHNTECSMKAIMLYGDKVDFCFREREDALTRIIIHNKTTNQVFDEYSSSNILAHDIIKRCISIIDTCLFSTSPFGAPPARAGRAMGFHGF